jgi:glycosyltransferase involved in cell wall biosynthesis
VGDGILRPAIENYVYNSQLNNVHLPGFVLYEELPKYFAVADVYVHPARIEPWGVTLNEAMVCMCPVVSADTVGSSKDLILEGETGFIFQSGNTEQLSSILLKLSKNKELRFLVAKQARAHIEKFSNDFICTELKRAIDTTDQHAAI